MEIRHAFAAQTEHRSGLRALGHGVFHLAVDRRHLDLRAERSLYDGYGQLVENGRVLALKLRMAAHAHRHKQIACGAAVASGVAEPAQGDGLPVVDTGGNVYLDAARAAHLALAFAGRARLMDDLACAAAAGARLLRLHHAERRARRARDGTAALAVGADLGGRALGAAGALALVAGLDLHNVQLAADAEAGLLKADLHLGADILTAHGGVRRALCAAEAAKAAEAAAKAAAEEVVQNIGEAAEALGA